MSHWHPLLISVSEAEKLRGQRGGGFPAGRGAARANRFAGTLYGAAAAHSRPR